MKKIEISVSSLAADNDINSQLEYALSIQAADADRYHLDIMDGRFVKNNNLKVLKSLPLLSKTLSIPIDVHLMVKNPKKYLNYLIRHKVSIVTVHIEVFNNEKDLLSIFNKLRKAYISTSICIDLESGVAGIEKYLPYVNNVLVMSVKAGAGGQEFNVTALEKVKAIKRLRPDIFITIDGGINDKNAVSAVNAGVDILAVGSYIYNAKNKKAAIKKLRGANG